ncbi:unnamed protein product, partial [Prorocentrum cordatum]
MARACSNVTSFKEALDASDFDRRDEFLAGAKCANIEVTSPCPKDPAMPLMVFVQHFGAVPNELRCQECGSKFTMSGTSDRAARWARRGPRRDLASCCDACGDVEISMAEGTLLADVKASSWLPLFDCVVAWTQECPRSKIMRGLDRQRNVVGPWMEKFQDVAASYIADEISFPKLHEAFEKRANAKGNMGVKKTISKKKQTNVIAQADEVFLNKDFVFRVLQHPEDAFDGRLCSNQETVIYFDTLGLRMGTVVAADGWKAAVAAIKDIKDRDGESERDLKHEIVA